MSVAGIASHLPFQSVNQAFFFSVVSMLWSWGRQ
jgi:hypothetical protein